MGRKVVSIFKLTQFVWVVAGLLTVSLYGLDGTEKRSIAVLEFEGKGVTEIEASTLTDRFRSELVRTDMFVQIERSRIEKIFEEQKLQLSGVVSDDKLQEIGELLGAELLVIGSIGKLGSTYTIDLRLVEVSTGEIIASYFKDHRGEVDGLLGQFQLIASEIAGKETAYEATKSSEVLMAPTSGLVLTDILSAQIQARNDAREDLSKFAWSVGGAATGAGGSCLIPVVGGAAGVGAAYGAGYLMNANPPPERLAAIQSSEMSIQTAYIKAYEKELKKSRAKWGGISGVMGCCVTTILLLSVLTSAGAGS